jgi:hypothetical protein
MKKEDGIRAKLTLNRETLQHLHSRKTGLKAGLMMRSNSEDFKCRNSDFSLCPGTCAQQVCMA